MKTLFLARHAKSNWDDHNLTDIERPLNSRGLHDAPRMGKLLFEKNVKPDLIISSPAERAFSTAQIFAKEFGYAEKKIVSDSRIYEASMKHLVEVIHEIDDAFQTVMMIGHNPEFTNIANQLGDKFIDSMPTCSVVGIEMNIISWTNVERHCGKIVLFEYPKKSR